MNKLKMMILSLLLLTVSSSFADGLKKLDIDFLKGTDQTIILNDLESKQVFNQFLDENSYQIILNSTKSILKKKCKSSDISCKKKGLQEIKRHLQGNLYGTMNAEIGSDQGTGGWNFEGKILSDSLYDMEVVLLDVLLINSSLLNEDPNAVMDILFTGIENDL
ncbi:hypothetical protein HBN50_03935 [Halobacteriovorax sp. GB3]|uniref:hypothetical protein n=1 Tax=Halobacteriovorax sp. GB3 TaxID=2719615 RepID=UPI0023610903|nr:hypothetical protein [Halobacteriovorax sp. GB3]MDD0852230.1 hypothetical protein [Halobacteriovorax sp. GB3]